MLGGQVEQLCGPDEDLPDGLARELSLVSLVSARQCLSAVPPRQPRRRNNHVSTQARFTHSSQPASSAVA
jgi:hypothetical protein